MKLRLCRVAIAMFSLVLATAAAQQTSSSAGTPSETVPPLIQFSNVATDEGGNTMSGVVSITFSLYSGPQGGEPLWSETQNNVLLDSTGHYSVELGITKQNGVPTALFTTGEARWLGIQIAEQPPQPRLLLLSVPYALKAGDAATIGGLPPSAFVLAASQNGTTATYTAESATGQSVSSATSTDVTTTGGTADYLPIFSGASTIIDSAVFQTGASPTAKIGINTATPATTLDVKGTATIRGTLSLPATGAAKATQGANSQAFNLTASAFSGSTSAAVNQTFRWQAEPAGNDTSTPSGTLNLLFGEGTSAPEETGLHIASNGQITFAAGQTFPGTGTGDGTITGLTAGTDLTGGGTSGTVTLNLDTTQVPQLNTANTFTGNQTMNGNLSATGVVTGSGFQIGSNLFAFGSYANANALLGFAGNSSMSGVGNTASGEQALFSDTTGAGNTASGSSALLANTTGGANTASGSSALYSNTSGGYNAASGYAALYSNTTGSYNAASGEQALFNNTTGSYNTATGFMAGETADNSAGTGSNNTAVGANIVFSTGSLTNATAIGANSEVSENNALVLGCVVGWDNCGAAVNVGIGTTAPAFALDVHGTGHFTQPVTFGSPVNFASGQTFPGTGRITGVTANTGLTGGGTSGTVSLALAANACASGSALTALPFTCSAFATTGANAFTASQSVQGSLAVTGAVTGGSVTATGSIAASGNVTGTNVTATGIVTGEAFTSTGAVNATTSFNLGGMVFAFGSPFSGDQYLGFAGNMNSSNTGTLNTGSGGYALHSNTTGSSDTAGGFNALLENTTGSDNTATGASALLENTTGSDNTATGYEALYSNTTGNYNLADGYQALSSNTTANYNTASGYEALLHSTGSGNTGLGSYALYNTTTGSNNTVVGFNAGGSNAAGSANTLVGYYAATDPATPSLTNATAIGAYADVAQSNSLVLGGINGVNGATASTNVGIGTTAPTAALDVEGNSVQTLIGDPGCGTGFAGIGFVGTGGFSSCENYALSGDSGGNTYLAAPFGSIFFRVSHNATTTMEITNGQVGIGTAPTNVLTLSQSAGDAIAAGWATYSSLRWKTNIQPLQNALGKIEQLRGVSYDLKDSGKHEIGVIAEEVGKVIPEVVTYEENGKDARGVDYSRLTALLIEAVKQQQRQINTQQRQVAAQQRQIRSQQSQIARLTGKVSVLETALRTAGQAKKSPATVRSAAVKTPAAVLMPPKN